MYPVSGEKKLFIQTIDTFCHWKKGLCLSICMNFGWWHHAWADV